MLSTILSRLGQGCIVVLLLLTITFVLIRMMPGDPFVSDKAMPPHIKEQNEKRFKLNEPIPVQYLTYLGNLTQGDMGISITRDQPVTKIIKSSFPASAILGIAGIIIAVCVGVPAGILSALRKNSLIDYGTMMLAMLGTSVPSFVLAPILASTVASNVSFLKVAGWGGPFDWFLPSLTLGLATAAYLARITRGGMLEILNQDFIRTAKAKGVPSSKIIIKHALRGGIIPAIAFVGPSFAMLMTGSFIVETIFQVPGMGQHFVNSIKELDSFLLQGVVVVLGILIVIGNLAADITLVVLNPRLRETN